MLLKGGIILDGSGKDRFVADIRLKGKKILEIGNLEPEKKEEVINIAGSYVAPGFVDILNHSDAFITLFENPAQESLLRQGITTVLMGNCGSSLAPLRNAVFINSIQKWGDISKINVNWLTVEEYLDELRRHKFGINLATLIGHSTVRRGFAGNEPRSLSDEELAQMEYMLDKGLEEGAFGISLGLGYAHGNPATRREIEVVASLAKKHTSLLSVHIRNDAEKFAESIEEIKEIAEISGVNTEISHLKISAEEFNPDYAEVLDEITKMQNINFDIYPYRLSAAVLYSFLPQWATEKGNSNLFENIKTVSSRQKLIQEMKKGPYAYKDMVLAMGKVNPTFFGKTIGEIARKQETSPEEAVLNLILTSNNRVIVFSSTLNEKNLINALKHSKSFISSDGVGYSAKYADKGDFVHPRYFGTFPKFIGEYVREKNILSLEEAIHKITFAPAQKIKLAKRGRIAKGFYGDLVVFDYDSIGGPADFSNPFQYPQGVNYVFVNGQIAIDKNKLNECSGQILTKHDI